MKSAPFFLCAFFTVGGAVHAAAFLNLGFDQAVTNNVRAFPTVDNPFAGAGTASDLLPGWNATLGGAPVSFVNLNSSSGGEENISAINLISRDAAENLAYFESKGLYFDGEFSLGFNGIRGASGRLAISQTGDVPVGGTTLEFTFSGYLPSIQINGQELQRIDTGPFFPLTSKPTYIAYDISAWTGQTVTLRIANDLYSDEFGGSSFFMDGLAIVPEPSPFALLGLGCLGLLVARNIAFRRHSSVE